LTPLFSYRLSGGFLFFPPFFSLMSPSPRKHREIFLRLFFSCVRFFPDDGELGPVEAGRFPCLRPPRLKCFLSFPRRSLVPCHSFLLRGRVLPLPFSCRPPFFGKTKGTPALAEVRPLISPTREIPFPAPPPFCETSPFFFDIGYCPSQLCDAP